MEQSRVEIASPWKHFIDRIGILRFYTDPKYQQWISATQAVGEYQAGT
jgi:multimeric flavodoxin WrbA